MEELEKYWDRFSSTFDKNFTATTTLFGQQLMVMLPLRDPKVSKVLEVGCGSGQGTPLTSFAIISNNYRYC
jgi:ubiquinone/menaquinone biosynthesis C-methylase UbiE